MSNVKEQLSTTQLSCRKCGSKNIHTAFHENEYDCCYDQRGGANRQGEHLHYHCRGCSYSWTGKTLEQRQGGAS